MPRKTFNVDELRDRVNRMLETPDSSLYLKAPGTDREMTPAEAFRMGLCSVIEGILHETGNYKGFGYHGMIERPGLAWEIPDETRRVYY